MIEGTSTPTQGPSQTSPSPTQARLLSGTILAGRYRIVGLLGRGGMGDVYRADDLKLEHTVALKFLPEALTRDAAMLTRFHAEVRVARQVSHPHVCRVHDIGDVEGRHFISMEYIDGEDLASLLRRIGRLPAGKAVEIARQLCAGLAAAHDSGVLHRDLKPANIMIDGRGKVRVTDFGLAGLAEAFRGDEVMAGTPAYMAPEQLAGKAVTVKSDIYALGLVLYEVFTGKRAFQAGSITELLRLQEQTTPTSPSSLESDIDPLVERVILRCLERDPDNRPASTLQVAAALPGGDPLQAALAAGVTPSPEMVAAASTEGSLQPAVAAACLVGVLAGLILIALLSAQVMLQRLVPLDKSPEALQEHAREIYQKLGYHDSPTDSAYGFNRDDGYLQYVIEHDQAPTRWNQLATGQPAALYFSYRQSPRHLETASGGDISPNDPPFEVSGMANVLLDPRGRLLAFRTVPSQSGQPAGPPEDPNWPALFAEAGLDVARFTPTEPKYIPPVYSDVRAAWDGSYPDRPDIPIHIETAAYRGRPVDFEILGPWSQPPGVKSEPITAQLRALYALLIVLMTAVTLGGVWLTRRNLRLGRGDRKGAFRLALYAFSMTMVGWVVSAHHVPTILGEFTLLSTKLAWAVLGAGILWLLYIGLEPYVRRRWPERIISWTRLLAGGFRDPLVGRDLLIGMLGGVVRSLLFCSQPLIWRWLGWPPGQPFGPSGVWLNGLRSMGGSIGLFFGTQGAEIFSVLSIFFLLVLLSILLRKDWLAIGVLWVLFTVASYLFAGATATDLFPLGLGAAVYIFILTRFGLLAMVSGHFFFLLFEYFPITSDLSVWYAGSSALAFAAAAAVAIYGFYTSLAGRSVFQGNLLED
jgi:serine/threonine-protein kinase